MYLLKNLSVVGGKNRGKARIRVIGQYRTVFNLHRLVKSESEKKGEVEPSWHESAIYLRQVSVKALI